MLVSSDDVAELDRMRILNRRRHGLVFQLLREWYAGGEPDHRLLPPAGLGPLSPADGVPVIPLGRSFPLRLNGAVANIGLPVDIRSRLERLLIHGGFDLVHVHEPLAPSLSFTAVREARSPVLSTFHLSPLGLLAYEREQAVLARFFERLDGRIVTFGAAAAVLAQLFAGEVETVSPGIETTPGDTRRPPMRGQVLYVFRGDDRRGLRAFFRALLTHRAALMERLVVAVHRPSAERWPPRSAPRRLAALVEWREFDDPRELEPWYGASAVTVLPFLGSEWTMQTALESLSSGCPAIGPDLPSCAGLLTGGATGACFSPSSETSLVTALNQVLAADVDRSEVARLGAAHSMDRVAPAVTAAYERCLEIARARTAADDAEPRSTAPRAVRRSMGPIVAADGWILADLHVHSNHSKDSTSPVEAILSTAREVGLGALAIADHNTIAGALEARALAASQDDDLVVIVAEEVMTQHGEVIGLFLERPIPKGLTFDQALEAIKEQGGLVYVPHPFDRLRTTPSYRSLVDNLHRIDVIETYNARVALSSFNVNAERFAAKYHIVAGAGSDAHVLPGLGTALLRMPRFDGPEEFMRSLREADILSRRKSLLYLQSLKLLQTTLDHVLSG